MSNGSTLIEQCSSRPVLPVHPSPSMIGSFYFALSSTYLPANDKTGTGMPCIISSPGTSLTEATCFDWIGVNALVWPETERYKKLMARSPAL